MIITNGSDHTSVLPRMSLGNDGVAKNIPLQCGAGEATHPHCNEVVPIPLKISQYFLFSCQLQQVNRSGKKERGSIERLTSSSHVRLRANVSTESEIFRFLEFGSPPNQKIDG